MGFNPFFLLPLFILAKNFAFAAPVSFFLFGLVVHLPFFKTCRLDNSSGAALILTDFPLGIRGYAFFVVLNLGSFALYIS